MATIQIHGTLYRVCVMGDGVQMLNAYDCLLHDDMGYDVSGLLHDTASICLVHIWLERHQDSDHCLEYILQSFYSLHTTLIQLMLYRHNVYIVSQYASGSPQYC